MGICAGIQEINVIFGGTLYQDIKGVILYLTYLKDFNATYFIKESKPFFNDIIKDKNISNEFKIFIKNFSLIYFNIK